MKAMLHWQNGDRQEVELHASNLRPDGHPNPTLHDRGYASEDWIPFVGPIG